MSPQNGGLIYKAPRSSSVFRAWRQPPRPSKIRGRRLRFHRGLEEAVAGAAAADRLRAVNSGALEGCHSLVGGILCELPYIPTVPCYQYELVLHQPLFCWLLFSIDFPSFGKFAIQGRAPAVTWPGGPRSAALFSSVASVGTLRSLSLPRSPIAKQDAHRN